MLGCLPCLRSDPGVQQQVVWFDVSVDEAQLVDGVDGQNRLGDVELRGLFGQRVLLHQQRHHVAWQQKSEVVSGSLGNISLEGLMKYLQAGTP